ncbi:MiaB/RimO family radical SAM methylthiotransferase [Patescibacteria group bacterium]|nr:MiaB/RimO family radical SAM methylthiotransferase [Patescibacteria group bacterium]MCL5091882.1 MiaB/RimO family radical SAM methylthiotransferase [Patescibacteria group bacterium]
MIKRFASFSFGCRVNMAEKIELDQALIGLGFRYDPDRPELFIINTCAVTGKAERETRQLVYQLRRRFPGLKIVLTGCSATYWKKHRLFADLPVDLVVTNRDKARLPVMIQTRFSSPSGNYKIDKNQGNKYLESGRYLIKIQDGCRRFCSYCIVPYLRTEPATRPIAQIVGTIDRLDKNIKEVILTAINTEVYGDVNLVRLIKAVHSTKIARLSFGSIHPWSLSETFLRYYRTIADSSRFVDFFHVPLQSGANRILRLMRRDYNREEIEEKLIQIRRANPRALIATDIITGFLDETERDFKETCAFLQRAPIYKLHVFRFSRRRHTAADFMAKRLPELSSATKLKRSRALIKLGEEKYARFIGGLRGWRSTALFINHPRQGGQPALLENQVPVWIPTTKDYAGEIKHVIVTEIRHGQLTGKLV